MERGRRRRDRTRQTFGGASFTAAALLLVVRMPSVCGGSFWFCGLMLTSLCWGGLSASTSSPSLPTPTLDIYYQTMDSVVLVCRAPGGHRGVLFMLYHDTEKVESQTPQSAAEQVHFTVRMEDWDSGRRELFCCVYRNQAGQYSAFSTYLRLERLRAEGPTLSTPPLPPPVLSVEPSSGVVKRGDVLRFRCTLSSPSPQSSKPPAFLLIRTFQTQATSVILQPQAGQVSNARPQQGVFTVGPVQGGEEGEYTCLYQLTKKRGLVNSTVSNVVEISMTGLLPVPSLTLQQQTDVWHFLCTGSASYPGAVFSLYLADHEQPIATRRVTVIQHQATFSVPVQDTLVALYRCQYRVLLGTTWRASGQSAPLTVTRQSPSPASPGVDWPLVLGAFAAAVLFLCALLLVVVLARRKVKAAAMETKRRQEAQFWTQPHVRDHDINITLRPKSLTSQEWSSRDTETSSRSPLWNSVSTFTTPIH